MEIRQCTSVDYPKLLNVLNEAFDYAPEAWFQTNLAHCTPYPNQATAAEIENHWVCEIDGKIAGGLGAYPLDWVVSDANGDKQTIHAYGIGQVCCLEAYRNRGVMTALMNASAAYMHKQGRTVGFLTGDRRRYGFFGYEYGGNKVKYRLDKKLLTEQAVKGSLINKKAELSDWPELNKAYQTLPTYIERTARHWELHFSRTGIEWHIGECDGRKGYMASKSDDRIIELYGDPAVLAAMLLQRAESLPAEENISVIYPSQNVLSTPVGQMLYRVSSVVEAHPLGLFARLDSRLNFYPLPDDSKNPPLCAWIAEADYI